MLRADDVLANAGIEPPGTLSPYGAPEYERVSKRDKVASADRLQMRLRKFARADELISRLLKSDQV